MRSWEGGAHVPGVQPSPALSWCTVRLGREGMSGVGSPASEPVTGAVMRKCWSAEVVVVVVVV